IEADGRVLSQIRIRVTNRSDHPRDYQIVLDGVDAEVISPENPLPVAAGEIRTTSIFVRTSRDAFSRGRKAVSIRLDDGQGFSGSYEYSLVGPEGAPGGGGR
ncbi:MAG: FixG Ig-like domain-containing protein, partial [Gemmatimonadales bacterium]